MSFPSLHWYLRSPQDIMDAHFVTDTGVDGTVVRSVCGAVFEPVAVFNCGSKVTAAPDPRVCADGQILEAALPDSQRIP